MKKPTVKPVNATERTVSFPEKPDIRPQIVIEGGKLPEIVDQAERATLAAQANLYLYGGQIVRPIVAGKDKQRSVTRHDGAIVLGACDSAHLSEVFTTVAEWVKYDARSGAYKAVDCPRRIAEVYLSRLPAVNLRTMTGLIEAPTLRSDGTVFDDSGYDEISGLYYAGTPPQDYTPPQRRPKKEDGERALQELLSLVGDFAVVGMEDAAAIVSAIISAIVRRSLPAAPLVAITANAPGTGKSYLGDVISVISTGRRCAVLSLGDDQSEGQKRLTGALIAGDSTVMIDNVERPLADDLLCQIVTQPILSVRPLGGSQLLRVPTNCTLIANGNNLDVRGDMRRRVILIRLDAGMERPERRAFSTDALHHAREHRGSLIRAALTLPLAYMAAGSPDVGSHPYGGFAEWDAWCRRPLLWLGLPDPLVASEELRDVDPDLATQRQLFAAWHSAYGNNALPAADVISGAGEELKEAINAACSDHLSPRRLAGWLRRHRGRIVDGLRLDGATDSHRKIALWRITVCG